jgi:N-acetylneuraminic acid mutarotase
VRLLLAAAVVAAFSLGAPPATAQTAPGTPGTMEPAEAGPWARRAELLQPNSEIAVAELDSKIYVIGGYPSDRVVTNAVQVYDSALDTWQEGPALPMPLHHTVAAAVNGVLYVIGGEFEPSGVARQGVYQNTVWAYDPRREVTEGEGAWLPRAPMPTARSAMATGAIDGKIYVAGGRPPRGHDFAVYDTAADEWTVLPDLPTQRNHLAATAIGGKIYVAGGRFGAGVGSEMTAALEIFDPASGTWTAGAPLPAPRAGVNGIAAHGCFYVFGGEGNDAHPMGIFAENEAYDPATDTWQPLTPLPVPVHGVTGAAFLGGWIHLPGGGTSRGGSSGSTIHQVYRPERSCDGT